MDRFDKLKAEGYFADSFTDKSLIQFCFQNTIQVQYSTIQLLVNTDITMRNNSKKMQIIF